MRPAAGDPSPLSTSSPGGVAADPGRFPSFGAGDGLTGPSPAFPCRSCGGFVRIEQEHRLCDDCLTRYIGCAIGKYCAACAVNPSGCRDFRCDLYHVRMRRKEREEAAA
ncbi:MAG: hypothetical protein M1377_00325 [Deltaproteobacteria bacterium]|nr:hypothetical protein [Deltaproteobacteria bacterium]